MKGPILFLLEGQWDCMALEARGTGSGSRCFVSCWGAQLVASFNRLCLIKVPFNEIICHQSLSEAE